MVLVASALLVAAQIFPHSLTLSMRHVLRRVGGVVGGVGGTILFAGMVGALSTRAYMRWLAVAGAVVALAGVAGFGYAYPYQWGVGQDLSIPVILVVTAGFTMLIGATFAATVSNLILRQRVREDLREELGREPTDEEVARDVEEALAQYTWGGMKKTKDRDRSRKIAVKEEPAQALEVHGWKTVESEDVDVGSLDRSLDQLKAFRGGAEQTGELEEGGSVGTNSAALTQLRQDKAEAEAKRPWNRFKARVANVGQAIRDRVGRGDDEETAEGEDGGDAEP